MILLLDTRTLIWALEDNPTLSAAAREAIVDGNNIVFVSAVSVWEISIKKALGKLDAPDTLLEEIERHRFTPLEDFRAGHSPQRMRHGKVTLTLFILWSIRINEQWRICFRFADGDAFDVEIVDYH